MQQLSTVLLTVLLKLAELAYSLPVPHAQRWKSVQQGWSESSGQATQIVPWIMGLLVIGALLFGIIYIRRDKARQREREFVYYQRKSQEKGLDPQCLKLLDQAVKTVGIEQPFRILDSYDIFQHVMETYEHKSDFSEQERAYFNQMADKIKEGLGFRQIEEAVPLTTSHEIKPGQIVKIRLSRDGQEFEFDSAVLNNDEKMMSLDGTAMDFDYLGLGMDAVMDVAFYRESDAGYSLKSMMARMPDTEKKIIFLKHPKKMERSQARNFSRMEVCFPFSYYHLEKDKFNKIEIDTNLAACDNRPVYRGESVDISGGGIAFNTFRKIGKGDFLYLNFQMLSENHSEPLLAEVVWTGQDKKRETIYLVRAKFYSITDKMQDELMKFVYQMQRRVARRMKFSPKR